MLPTMLYLYASFFISQNLQFQNFDLESDPSLSLSPLEIVPPLQEDQLAYDFFLADCYDLSDFDQIYIEEDLKMEKNVCRNRKKLVRIQNHQDLKPLEFLLDNNLNGIIDEAKRLGILAYERDQLSEESYQSYMDQLYDEIDSSQIQIPQFNEQSDTELKKQQKQSSHTSPLQTQYALLKKWSSASPKKQLISRIKNCYGQSDISQKQKIENIKDIMEQYVFDFEKFYLNECMSQLKEGEQILTLLIKGIEQTFKKTIGGISFDKRRIKLLKYMDKKKKRDWKKKVNYDCRKKVADGRLRFKGKFVTEKKKVQEELRSQKNQNVINKPKL